MEVETVDPAGFLECFENLFSDVLIEYDVVGEYDEVVLVQYEMPTPELYRTGRQLGSFAQFPIPIQDGWLVFDLVLSESALSHVEATFDELGYPYRITSVTRSYDSMDLLTSRQREFVDTAIEHGYYDEPRGCSLTDLAAEFDVKIRCERHSSPC